jgi:hypothetical protein
MLLLLAAVTLIRVPEGGIQPQTAVDPAGVVHLIYFKGDPKAGDIFYVSSKNGGASFSPPLKVNSQPGSVIAVGNIRGAHLALGVGGRPHVAWMGSAESDPKSGMFYTRLNEAGTGFEPQLNVIQQAWGLDGGGSVAADTAGNVYVVWHAPEPGTEGEDHRAVWVATSRDSGAHFSKERRAWDRPTGACGCCGMAAFAPRAGELQILYRSATDTVHRDMYLLTSADAAQTFIGVKVDEWEIGACVMSSAGIAPGIAAWETKGAVFADSDGVRLIPKGQGKRKYPSAVRNSRGETLLVWAEDTGWSKGGGVAWQIFARDGTPGESGRAPGVPAWSLVSAIAKPDGSFVVLY